MLIVLDESLNDSLEASLADDEVEVLDYIASAWRRGIHCLAGDRAVFERLSTYADLSRPAQAAYEKLSSAITTLADGLDRMHRHLTIVGNGAKEGQSDCGLRISLGRAIRLLPFDQTTLLVENAMDGRFFEVMGRYYLRQEGLGGVRLSLEMVGGGGDTTALTFEQLRRDNRKLCLCIVDSDRKADGGPVGQTARPLLQWHGLEETREVYVLAVREAENLLPLQVLSMALRTTEDILGKQEMLEAIAKLERGADVLAFLDMKRGLSFWEVSQPQTPTIDLGFVEVLRGIASLASRMDDYSACVRCSKKAHCKCMVIEGLGTKALACVTDFLERSTDHGLPPLTLVQKEEWLRVGELVASWGCAPARSAAV